MEPFRDRANINRCHSVKTEAETLEEACEILHDRLWRKHISEANKARPKKPQTWRQELGCYKGKLELLKIAAQKRAVQKQPHPFWDLDDAAKKAKAIEMFESGLWGLRGYAERKLAARFRVTVGQMVIWLEGARERM